ncbi:MAG TPA: choice-of-anchor R domain-containing protein [Terriglobales bacterium]|nr:choice-of-anchor R domain-containing protein [Terriglobales bacterium]
MFSKKLLVSIALVFAGATAIAAAQNDVALRGHRTTVWGKHARMTVVTEPAPSFTTTNLNDSGLVTIFSNLAATYPKGEYWCCTGYNVMGSNSGVGEQWMAAAFTPGANHTVTRIEVAVGYSQQGTNGVVLSLNRDSHGIPGKALRSWSASNLPRFGTCCTLVVKSDKSGIPVSAGKQYWIVLSTNSNELDTVDVWSVDDTNQLDSATVATYPGTSNHWKAFQTTPGLAFAVKGSN